MNSTIFYFNYSPMTLLQNRRLTATLLIPIALGIILIVLSKSIGWNVTTLILYWFACIPILSVYIPEKISNNKNHLAESISGLLIFYLVMVFLIYGQSHTDYFKLMIASIIINLGLVILITVTGRPLSMKDQTPRG